MNEELYHHGVKGQKWGVRRYRNEDGTLTEEGKRKKNIETLKAWGATALTALPTSFMLRKSSDVIFGNSKIYTDKGYEITRDILSNIVAGEIGSNVGILVARKSDEKYDLGVEDKFLLRDRKKLK